MKKIGIAIIGAGPAGLQAAISTAQAGYPSVVFEEHPILGQPIQCGEGVSISVINDFSLKEGKNKFCVKEHERCQLVFPAGKAIYGDIRAFMVRRDIFDQFLGERASNLGVEIKTSTKVVSIQQMKDGIQLKTAGKEKKEYFCKFLILAEGAKSTLAKSLNFYTPQKMIKAFEYKIKGEWGEDLEFHFDSQLYPYGYCWVFPRNNETNVGIVTTAKGRKDRLDSFLKRRKITGEIKQKVGGQIPMNGPVEHISGGNILLVGDTAGMVNPIFYGGIRIGMMSGKIAGEVIAQKMAGVTDEQYHDIKEYRNRLMKYAFMKDINMNCHNFFYTRTNKYLRNIGNSFDKLYINQIEKYEIVKVIGRILKNPSLLKNLKGLYWIYRGFKIARDWGF